MSYASLHEFVGDMNDLVSRRSDVETTVGAVKQRLAELVRDRPRLPEAALELRAECYARHLLYQDPEDRFEMIVMAWSPGQRTPVHDHSGIWCVEGVLEGVIEVTRYDVRPGSGERVRMQEVDVIHAGLGQCGALIPPLEYHSIANRSQEAAYTLHVYGGRMTSCRVFTPREDGMWDVSVRPLGYSSPRAALPPV
jgi:predicted metal-dependent enzyme (double-stranded beta helix superfamily)